MNYLSSVPSIAAFMHFNDLREGMEAPSDALLVGIADDFLEQLFSRPASSFWSDSGMTEMSLWLGSGERSDVNAGGVVGFPLGFNLDERRRVFAISEEGDGSENNSLQETDVKSCTEEGETILQLPTGMSLGFGHVQSYQIRPNNPPQQVLHEQAAERGGQPPVTRLKVRVRGGKATDPHSNAERVLSMSRLGGACAVAQFVADIPLQLIELHGGGNGSIRTKQQVWEKWSNEGTERKLLKIMEEDVEAPMNFLHKALCILPISFASIAYFHIQSAKSSTLKPPEPNAPL